MSEYKLYYFDARGRAESARMLFKLKGVNFEDIRYTREEWQKVKKSFPMEQLPVLEIDGKKIGQSSAIYSRLARDLDAYGESSDQTARIDEIVGCIEDCLKFLMKIYSAKDDTEKLKLKEEFKTKDLPEWTRKFEPVLESYVKDYSLKDSKVVTLAEISIFNFIGIIKYMMGEDCVSSKAIQAFAERVNGNKNLKEYIENRPN